MHYHMTCNFHPMLQSVPLYHAQNANVSMHVKCRSQILWCTNLIHLSRLKEGTAFGLVLRISTYPEYWNRYRKGWIGAFLARLQTKLMEKGGHKQVWIHSIMPELRWQSVHASWKSFSLHGQKNSPFVHRYLLKLLPGRQKEEKVRKTK